MNNKSYCRNCGNELKPGDTFCAGCGSAVKSEKTQETQQVFVNSIATAAKKKISNKMIGIIICVAVVLVAIIGIIVAVCVSNSDASDLLGTWADPSDGDVVAVFNEDGTMYCDHINANYEITRDGEITITPIENYGYTKEQKEYLYYIYVEDGKYVDGKLCDILYITDKFDELSEDYMSDKFLIRVK